MTPVEHAILVYLLYTILAVGVAALILYGWSRQPTPEAKEDYMRKWLGLIAQIAPIALQAAGVPPLVTGIVTHAIVTAEQAGGTGAEKKAQALSIIADGLTVLNSTSKGTIVDAGSVSAAVSAGIDATVDTVKVVQSIPNHRDPNVANAAAGAVDSAGSPGVGGTIAGGGA